MSEEILKVADGSEEFDEILERLTEPTPMMTALFSDPSMVFVSLKDYQGERFRLRFRFINKSRLRGDLWAGLCDRWKCERRSRRARSVRVTKPDREVSG